MQLYLLLQSGWRGLCCWCHRNLVTSGKWEGVGSPRGEQRQADSIRPTDNPSHIHTADSFFFSYLRWHRFLKGSTQPDTMLHPLIIGIMTVNTSLTVVYWAFILGDAYMKWLVEPEDKPQKVVTPAWGSDRHYGPAWLSDWVLFCLTSAACSAFCGVDLLSVSPGAPLRTWEKNWLNWLNPASEWERDPPHR